MFSLRLYVIKKILFKVKEKGDFTDVLRSRKGFDKMVGKYNQPIKGFTHEPTTLGGVPAEWITPQQADSGKVLLYFHGGGYAVGSIETHRGVVAQIAKNAGCKAILINYRLAPENKYPAAIEDAVAAYQQLLTLGFEPKHIALGGDSAGGGVTMGTLLYIRDKGLPMPGCAIGLSPWVDLTYSGASIVGNKTIDPMLNTDAFPLWTSNYLGNADAKSIYASPIFHSLAGLPPIYIQVGEEEVLLDDSKRFAEKALSDGVSIQLQIYPKMFHVFQAFYRLLPQAREANAKLGAFIKSHLA